MATLGQTFGDFLVTGEGPRTKYGGRSWDLTCAHCGEIINRPDASLSRMPVYGCSLKPVRRGYRRIQGPTVEKGDILLRDCPKLDHHRQVTLKVGCGLYELKTPVPADVVNGVVQIPANLVSLFRGQDLTVSIRFHGERLWTVLPQARYRVVDQAYALLSDLAEAARRIPETIERPDMTLQVELGELARVQIDSTPQYCRIYATRGEYSLLAVLRPADTCGANIYSVCTADGGESETIAWPEHEALWLDAKRLLSAEHLAWVGDAYAAAAGEARDYWDSDRNCVPEQPVPPTRSAQRIIEAVSTLKRQYVNQAGEALPGKW